MKKKASLLFGAIAMLMVSILAIGGSTLAWFSAAKNPYVEQIEARVISSGSLLISNRFDGVWDGSTTGPYKAYLQTSEILKAQFDDGTPRNFKNGISGINEHNAVTPIVDAYTPSNLPSTRTNAGAVISKADGVVEFAQDMQLNSTFEDWFVLEYKNAWFINYAETVDNAPDGAVALATDITRTNYNYKLWWDTTIGNATNGWSDTWDDRSNLDFQDWVVDYLGTWGALSSANLIKASNITINWANYSTDYLTDCITSSPSSDAADFIAAVQLEAPVIKQGQRDIAMSRDKNSGRIIQEDDSANYDYVSETFAGVGIVNGRSYTGGNMGEGAYLYFPLFFRASENMELYLQLPEGTWDSTGPNVSYFSSKVITTNTAAQKQLELSLRAGFVVGNITDGFAGTNMNIYEPNNDNTVATKATLQGDVAGLGIGGNVIDNLYKRTTWYDAEAYTSATHQYKNKLYLGDVARFDDLLDEKTTTVVHVYVWIDGNDIDNTSYVAGGRFVSMLSFVGKTAAEVW